MAQPSGERRVRVGVIGCGGIAQAAHLPAIGRTEGAQLVAVADHYADLARAVARRSGLDEADAYGDVGHLLTRDDIEAIAVCASTPMHAELAEAALGAGKHVLVEKPMAVTTAEAERMVAAAHAADRILMIAYNHTYDLAAEHVRGLIDAGELGELLYGELFFYLDSGAWHAGAYRHILRSAEAPPRRAEPPQDPMARARDFVHNFGSHLLNLMRTLIGDPAGIDYASQIDDAGLWAVLDYGTFKVHFKNVLNRQPRFEKGVELVGRKKRVRIDLAPPLQRHSPGRVTVLDVESRTESCPVLADEWPFEREWAHFVACIRDGSRPLTSGDQAILDVTLAEEIAARATES